MCAPAFPIEHVADEWNQFSELPSRYNAIFPSPDKRSRGMTPVTLKAHFPDLQPRCEQSVKRRSDFPVLSTNAPCEEA